MRLRLRKNTAGRQHGWRGYYAAVDQVPVYRSMELEWTSLYMLLEFFWNVWDKHQSDFLKCSSLPPAQISGHRENYTRQIC
jgi:hypothetical protein